MWKFRLFVYIMEFEAKYAAEVTRSDGSAAWLFFPEPRFPWKLFKFCSFGFPARRKQGTCKLFHMKQPTALKYVRASSLGMATTAERGQGNKAGSCLNKVVEWKLRPSVSFIRGFDRDCG